MRARRAGRGAVVLFGLVLLTACAGGSQPGSPTPAPTVPADPSASAPATAAVTTTPTVGTGGTAGSTASASAVSTQPSVTRLSDAQWQRIVAAGVWRAGCPVGRDGLRRVEVPYVGFDGRTHRGALVVNADVAASTVRVFTALYSARFPIHRMVPVEAYGGDDDASMRADNTSAFNCRQPGQANAPSARSPHANGRAIDLNPYENPWKDPRCDCFQPDTFYGSQRSGTGVVVKGGTPWRAFTQEGWVWQDSTTTDYQHFDTGYPSRPLR